MFQQAKNLESKQEDSEDHVSWGFDKNDVSYDNISSD